MVFTYEVYVLIVVTAIFSSIGGAITEIWIKPYLKKLKRKHDRLISKVRARRKKVLF